MEPSRPTKLPGRCSGPGRRSAPGESTSGAGPSAWKADWSAHRGTRTGSRPFGAGEVPRPRRIEEPDPEAVPAAPRAAKTIWRPSGEIDMPMLPGWSILARWRRDRRDDHRLEARGSEDPHRGEADRGDRRDRGDPPRDPLARSGGAGARMPARRPPGRLPLRRSPRAGASRRARSGSSRRDPSRGIAARGDRERPGLRGPPCGSAAAPP